MTEGPAKPPFDKDSLPAKDIDFAALARDLAPLSYEKRLELLHFLMRPHYLEEIATHLHMARQAAQKHIDQLLEIGVIRKQPGRRESGPVVEYVIMPQRVFALSEEFAKLGVLKPLESEEALLRTQVVTKAPKAGGALAGPALLMVHGMKTGSVYRLSPGTGPWTMGRDADRTICVDYDPFVSNRHAELQLRNGQYVLLDTFSTNGTFLNWMKLDRGAEMLLTPGDVIGVGKSLLVFRA
jgi:DNA-binding MarR family transcriptional regulator